MEYVTADWGGTEGIAAELREIQKQINHLDNPTNPQQVGGGKKTFKTLPCKVINRAQFHRAA